jgi:hypothetical protein
MNSLIMQRQHRPTYVCARFRVGSTRRMRYEPGEESFMTVTFNDLRVMLSVPNDKSFLRLVRLVVSSTAADLGFDFEEVEDLRIVADEVAHLAMTNTLPHAMVDLEVFPAGPDLRLVVSAPAKDSNKSSRLDPLASEIVAGLAASFDVAVVDGRFEAKFRSCPPKNAP